VLVGFWSNDVQPTVLEEDYFMNLKKTSSRAGVAICAAVLVLCAGYVPAALALVVGGMLDPTKIPKYEIPLIIPPVMDDDGTENSCDIAVRTGLSMPTDLCSTRTTGPICCVLDD